MVQLGQLAPGMYNDRLFSMLRSALTDADQGARDRASAELMVRFSSPAANRALPCSVFCTPLIDADQEARDSVGGAKALQSFALLNTLLSLPLIMSVCQPLLLPRQMSLLHTCISFAGVAEGAGQLAEGAWGAVHRQRRSQRHRLLPGAKADSCAAGTGAAGRV